MSGVCRGRGLFVDCGQLVFDVAVDTEQGAVAGGIKSRGRSLAELEAVAGCEGAERLTRLVPVNCAALDVGSRAADLAGDRTSDRRRSDVLASFPSRDRI